MRDADAEDAYIWHKRVIVREDGSVAEIRKGVVQVLNYNEPTSATDSVKANFTLDYYGEYEETYYPPV